MSFNYEQAYQQVRKSLGKHQISFSQAIDSESSVNKRESFYSEVFFASALKKCIDRKGQLIEQTGENIIAVDLGGIFPRAGITTLLDAAIFMRSDEYEICIDNHGDKCQPPQSRGFLVKTACDGRELNINLNRVYDGLKHIDALLTFTKVSVLEENNNFDIININNNENVNRLISLISHHYQTTVKKLLI